MFEGLRDLMASKVASLSIDDIRLMMSDATPLRSGEEYLREALMNEWERRDADGFAKFLESYGG